MPRGQTLAAGRLRHRIVIESYSESRDSEGGISRSWSTADTVWAAIMPLKGKEVEEARKISDRTSHKILIRYYDGLTPSHRFKWGSRYFNIVEIVNSLEIDKMMNVLVEEVL